jgi:hypothetical protein
VEHKTVESLFPSSPLERVAEGMTVVDAQNRPLGKVARVWPGYPFAVTVEEEEKTAGGPIGLVVVPLENPGGSTSVGVGTPFVVRRMLNDQDIPDELQLELLRAGFIELDAPGLRGAARYIHGDQVVEVTQDVVRVKDVGR